MIERALSVTPPEVRGLRPKDLAGYGRVYLGSEFCRNLLPSADDVRALKDKGAAELTVLTPLLPAAPLKAFLKTFDRILRVFPGAELSLSDLGLMRAVNRAYGKSVPLLLGRPVSVDFVRMDEKFLERFFAENNLRRLEIDDPDRAASFGGGAIKLSFHYPFRYLAMTKFCPFKKKGVCSRSCAGRTVKIRQTPPYSGDFFLRNNSYFAENRAAPPKGIGRTVFPLSAGARLFRARAGA
ncbi:MAG: hypothetical protein FD189_233 [Elusimicrobia bacterium]|nr:MAG: hypothetical protein FD154_33 [Elusimicrobiota bacterium]KAF0157966.1 MAG: hypothetical protein FD189_233 [Elusimicrobiota bacterium]